MKYPKISKQPRREINIPKLSGGLNLRDSLTGARDNQMTDCVNMWYKDGFLRTRPPFVTSNDMLNIYERTNFNERAETRFHNEIKIVYKGTDCICATNKRLVTKEDATRHWEIEFEFQGVEKIFIMPTITGILSDNVISYFCTEMCGTL